MEARTLQISGIIQRNTLLRIPYFQRRYVWEEKHWQRFAEDMESTINSVRDYFLGAIILKNELVTIEDNRNGIGQKYLVIDGQQRLTTLTIYMKVLHMLTGQNTEFTSQYLQYTNAQAPVIIHCCEDLPIYCKIMNLDTLDDINGDANIIKAYMYFKQYLMARRQQMDLNVLRNMVSAKVRFVVISLNAQDDEQQIFDTINSLGQPLTTGELMKNFLYRENDEELYRATWKDVFDTDEACKFWKTDASKTRQEKSKENSTIERFFHAFVRIKMWDFRDQLTDVQKKSFVKINNVFDTCKAFVDIFGMDRIELANEIITFARLYKEYLNDSILNMPVPACAGIERISCFINATKNYVVIPYVLYILHTQNDNEERNRIFEYLESYLIRRVLANSRNGSYSELFSESLISNRICTAQALMQFISAKDEQSNLAMPNNNNILINTVQRQRSIDETLARIIYFLYETKLLRDNDGNFTRCYNDYYTELLMPKPSRRDNDNWPILPNDAEEEERRQQIGTLGNLFLLNIDGKRELTRLSNESLENKVNRMRCWSDGIRSNQILTNLENWSTQNIMDRNTALARFFSREIWTD